MSASQFRSRLAVVASQGEFNDTLIMFSLMRAGRNRCPGHWLVSTWRMEQKAFWGMTPSEIDIAMGRTLRARLTELTYIHNGRDFFVMNDLERRYTGVGMEPRDKACGFYYCRAFDLVNAELCGIPLKLYSS